jgi:hypothetical protein
MIYAINCPEPDVSISRLDIGHDAVIGKKPIEIKFPARNNFEIHLDRKITLYRVALTSVCKAIRVNVGVVLDRVLLCTCPAKEWINQSKTLGDKSTYLRQRRLLI